MRFVAEEHVDLGAERAGAQRRGADDPEGRARHDGAAGEDRGADEPAVLRAMPERQGTLEKTGHCKCGPFHGAKVEESCNYIGLIGSKSVC